MDLSKIRGPRGNDGEARIVPARARAKGEAARGDAVLEPADSVSISGPARDLAVEHQALLGRALELDGASGLGADAVASLRDRLASGELGRSEVLEETARRLLADL
ncbi:MAG: hypothetical protein R3F30_09660 [Planctomycetota bacterium]